MRDDGRKKRKKGNDFFEIIDKFKLLDLTQFFQSGKHKELTPPAAAVAVAAAAIPAQVEAGKTTRKKVQRQRQSKTKRERKRRLEAFPSIFNSIFFFRRKIIMHFCF